MKPRGLRAGDVIGIAAPASPFDRQEFEDGVAVLKSMGHEIRIPEELFGRRGYLAGSDEERAALLMDLFLDDSIQAVFCARGGFGSMRLLPLLPFEEICKKPKIFMGFSDITTLLVTLYQRCRLATFHGPLVTTLRHESEETRIGLMDALGSRKPLRLRPKEPVVLNSGKASGPVTGGNLTSLSHLMGTPFEPVFDGHLLLLEDRGEAPYRIDRMLSQLRLGGHLDGIAGVILGSFQDCEPVGDVHMVVEEAFKDQDVPILAGFEVGHGLPSRTVPIGVQAELDTEAGVLRFLEAAVE